MDTFNEAIRVRDSEGRDAALKIVNEQIIDFMRVDYRSLTRESPIFAFLRADERFWNFTDSCEMFYRSAVNLKRLVYGGIKNADGESLNMQSDPMEEVVQIYRLELEEMLRRVTLAHHEVKTFTPK